MQRRDQVFRNAAQPEAAHHDRRAVGNDGAPLRQRSPAPCSYPELLRRHLARLASSKSAERPAGSSRRSASDASSDARCFISGLSSWLLLGQHALPHLGRARRQPRRVAQSAACPPQIVGANRSGHDRHQHRGRDLRQVAERGHQSIVLFAVIGQHDGLAPSASTNREARRTASGGSGLIRNHGRPSNRSAPASATLVPPAIGCPPTNC